MDFDYSEREESFRQEFRLWLEENPPDNFNADTFETIEQNGRFRIKLDWQKKLHSGGWVGIHWPEQYGGRGATIMEQTIYQQELGRAGAPGLANPLGISLVGPTLMQWGTERQKQPFIPKILSAHEIW